MNIRRLKVFPSSVIGHILLVYAKCNFASVLIIEMIYCLHCVSLFNLNLGWTAVWV